ncbi:RAB6A-GEF complex partner protein 2 [Periophthalmus magnuspinnatus]|uniref:RAB6A-GEF complex partner protein 2 n=1 Tax=Periophthalmus magnuspinnatus TaxID=409849 RepID=UPI00145BD637|nr:RAB6A-GEF complex partner protein 2 [Periophthalmus magnuspinnatus]XP_055084909.1 RAB6A-GEF complex partner protein 2 [Periophthalmus magnuspinnatus]
MIEVGASMSRGPVFLAGELLECLITFTNPMSHLSTSATSEMLAWASAQIHCQFHASEGRVALPQQGNKQDVQAENNTVLIPSRGERGQCVLDTPPKILFCDLRLDPGESKTYSYSEVVPVDGPPSFRGQAVKYVYKLTIGCQRVNSPIKLLRVPFRVLVLQGMPEPSFTQDEEVSPSNPFLEEDDVSRRDARPLERALDLLMVTTSRRCPHMFNITNMRGKVAKFCIFKTVYRLGEDIIGTFNFAEGDIPCLQYSVSLQSEEEIQQQYQRRAGQGTSVTGHGRHLESCLHTASSHFSLPIPLNVTPGFSTDIVTLRWRLHFEFVTAREPMEPPVVQQNQSEVTVWSGAEHVDVDTFSWDLPIKVLPTNPALASHVSQFTGTNTINI